MTTACSAARSESRAWEPTYVTSGVIAPVTALMVDQGRVTPDGAARSPIRRWRLPSSSPSY